jgi:hypothetical protein
MVNKLRFGKTQSCTNYSSKDAFRNSILAGTAGAVGTGIAAGVLANYYSNRALNMGLEKGCDIWSSNPSNYSNWLYPIEYYEDVKQIIFDTLQQKTVSFEERKLVKQYENALYSVPVYDGVWGISKIINPSGQLCDIPIYNLKHNLIEIRQGNYTSMKNLNIPEFEPLNRLVGKILLGETKVELSRKFKKNTSFGSAGSILPYVGTGGLGGSYAQPSFGFGKKNQKSKLAKTKQNNSKKQKLELKSIKKSTRKGKKYMAIFIMPNGNSKTTHFGSAGMSDFTKHKDPERKQRYIKRHTKRENWKDPTTAGALSRYVLWNKPTLKASIVDYKKRFKFRNALNK